MCSDGGKMAQEPKALDLEKTHMKMHTFVFTHRKAQPNYLRETFTAQHHLEALKEELLFTT